MPRTPRILESTLWVDRPIEEVFAFFADARNLERITPPWLRFQNVAEVAMREGAVIDHRLRVRGIPMRWRSRIAAWQPPHRFVDEQVRGPYRIWVHEHRFAPEAGGTRIADRVRYLGPGGPLEPLVHALLVRRDLRRIFAFRERRLREIFATAPARMHNREPHRATPIR